MLGLSQVEVLPVGGPVVVGADDGAHHAAIRADAHAAWDELLDTMLDFGVLPDQAETPRATAARLGTPLSTPAAAAAATLSRAEEHARYARLPAAPGDLGAALSTVRGALAGQASRRTRITVLLLPPSVLHRWRRSVEDATTRVSATAATWAEPACFRPAYDFDRYQD